jgi:hypothetical protein
MLLGLLQEQPTLTQLPRLQNFSYRYASFNSLNSSIEYLAQ